MEFDLNFISKNAASAATPFVITNLDNQQIEIVKTGNSNENELIMKITENQ